MAAVTVRTITSYDKLLKSVLDDQTSTETMIMERYSPILRALAVVNSIVHDQGVAYAINTLTHSDGVDKSDSDRQLSSLAKLLGHDDVASLLPKSRKGNKVSTEQVDAADLAVAKLLPPRVALEHANSSIRLDAISRLKASIESSNDDDMGDGLGQALLRRLDLDDDAAVATVAGEIVASQLQQMIHYDKDSGMNEDSTSNSKPNIFSSRIDDLVPLAQDALSSLSHWTFIGKKDYSWSPIPPAKESKKKGKKKSTKGGNEINNSPLLSCISICGSIAKLMLLEEEVSLENMMDAVDTDDLNSVLGLFLKLFLMLAAHINTGSYDNGEEDTTRLLHEAVSKAASAEFLQLFNDAGGEYKTISDLVTKHPTCHQILTHFFSGSDIQKIDPYQCRLLWLALHSYLELLASSSSTDQPSSMILNVTSSLAMCQMQTYTEDSKKGKAFQWEVEFIGNMCKMYFSLLASGEERDVYEKGLICLASTSSSTAYEEIVKPAIISQFNLKDSSDNQGLTVLIKSCLQPQASKDGTARLLAIAKELIGGKKMDSKVARESIIPTFALLSHPERSIRESVIQLLEHFQLVKKDEMVSDVCRKATDKSSPLRSSLVMDGANTLPNLLGQIMVSSNSSASVQKFLIESCKTCALMEDGAFSNGGCQASAVILSALERAGENMFPLATRWDLAGHELFQALLQCKVKKPSLHQLRDAVLCMLKGVLVNEAQTGDDGMGIQISVGPSRSGRRTRSYSIGGSAFTTLQPYPTTMMQAVLDALSSSRESPLHLFEHVIQLVVMRQSWANGVFPKLNIKSRNAVASALLTLRTCDNYESAGSALFGLPLKCSDFMHLLKEVDATRSETDQAAVIIITDCIVGKLDDSHLGNTAEIAKLSTKLFDQLVSISSIKSLSTDESDSGGRDYTRVSLLQTLFAIHTNYKDQLSVSSEKEGSSKRRRSRSHSDVGSPKTLSSQADLLVGLVGGNPSVIDPLNSERGRVLSLSLLTFLCKESPSAVVASLLSALVSLAGGASSREGGEVDVRVLGGALEAIVPAFCMYAPSANLSLFSLIESVLGKIITSGSGNAKLLDHLVDALKTALPTKESSSYALSSLAACIMALQAFNLVQEPTNTDPEMMDTDHDDSNSRLEARVLSHTTSGIKIAVSLSLLQYAQKLMSYICDTSEMNEPSSDDPMKATISQIVALTLCGLNGKESTPVASFPDLSKKQKRSILYLANNLLSSVRDVLSSPVARRVVRKSKGDDAHLSLRLWNELMQTHSNILQASAKLANGTMSLMEKKFWAAAPVATNDCLENIQNLLPVSHFLESVSSALADEDLDTHIRKKSIRLLADRVIELSPDSPEASLFLEMVPDLVAHLDVNAESMTADSSEDSLASVRHTIIMQQGALNAIESFVRSLYPSTDKGKLATNAASVFLPALSSVTNLLNNTASAWIGANDNSHELPSGIADAQCQLLSSSALCLSTLITTLKARCLPQLPSIIKPLVESLKSVNTLLEDSDNEAGELLQLAILKTLHAIAETLPQFLLPYLSLLFSSNALPSKSLKHESKAVKASTVQLEITLAKRVQVRQLIPSLNQAISKNLHSKGSGDWQEACYVINVMNCAVESSQRADISPVIGKIVNGILMVYGYDGDDDSRSQLLSSANKCLLSLVMKLSEAQLRPLYARLREWRGGINEEDEGDGPVSSIRRHAFWSLSAELSKNLRSIFLPCLTSVVTDLIDELELAVSLLCKHNKKTEGFKRRRVEETADKSDEDLDKLKPLQPLLLCLEYALKADAHEGGDWTRGDDNQRYKMILTHLGKLLQAHVPKGTPLVSDLTNASAYQQLVLGVGTLENGNVRGCVTSLAHAAGNEQLWKPLNFAVLEACGHKRSEVRKAGISCLLSIIETIGEEYMVLLPECLPVLSELHEDADDEIVGMAKECVRQGEEMLGESLEDQL